MKEVNTKCLQPLFSTCPCCRISIIRIVWAFSFTPKFSVFGGYKRAEVSRYSNAKVRGEGFIKVTRTVKIFIKKNIEHRQKNLQIFKTRYIQFQHIQISIKTIKHPTKSNISKYHWAAKHKADNMYVYNFHQL